MNRPDWKDLRLTQPISDFFGYDRGSQSIYRYYIDRFIESQCDKIKGKVLEVGDSMYMDLYKDKISDAMIIHYKELRGRNSFIGDLTHMDSLPRATFDCFICTQTYNFIYDFRAAIEGSKYVLKPGGYLVATVSGIQQISKYDEARWGDYWRFTKESCERTFSDIFGKDQIEICSYGNVLSSIAALEGLSSSEITNEELNFNDPSYPLILGVLARKGND
ncbi:MAG: methyltransferase domain-containing protein [Bacteroidetes bacterium]|nr:methyltransferase domain-containing protein [Bacteroidota bacterium]